MSPEDAIRASLNRIAATSLHNLIIAIIITLGLLLWNRKQPLFSGSCRRFFSYFFLLWGFTQIISGYYVELRSYPETTGFMDYLGALLHPFVFNLETFCRFYQHSIMITFLENTPYFKLFHMMEIICFSIAIPLFISVPLSIGLALFNSKSPFAKFSLKILISIFFLVSAGNWLVYQIDKFLLRSSYRALQYDHSLQSKKDCKKLDQD